MANTFSIQKLHADYAGWAGYFSKRENALISRNWALGQIDTSLTLSAGGGLTHLNVATAGGSVTVTLPKAALCPNRVIRFRKIAAGNNMVIQGDAADGSTAINNDGTIAANATLTAVGDYAFIAVGNAWIRCAP